MWLVGEERERKRKIRKKKKIKKKRKIKRKILVKSWTRVKWRKGG